MSLFVVSQIMVCIAICSDVASFQFKEKAHIVSCLLVSCSMISLHFMLLGHWTAASLALLAAARFVTSLFTSRKLFRNLYVLAALIIAVLTFEGLLTVLCTVATIFSVFASFSDGDKPLRQLMMVSTSIWLVHNILAGSPAAVVMEMFFLGSNIVGYFRFYIRPTKQALH